MADDDPAAAGSGRPTADPLGSTDAAPSPWGPSAWAAPQFAPQWGPSPWAAPQFAPPQYAPRPSGAPPWAPQYGPPPWAPPQYLPPDYTPPQYGPPPWARPQYAPPPWGPSPWGPPQYGAPLYGGLPDSSTSAASGWQVPAPASWGVPDSYQQPGWGYQPYARAASGPPGPRPGLRWAGVGVRFGALLIDGVLLVGSLFAVGLLLTATGGAGSGSRADSPTATAIGLMWWLVVLAYNPVCWYVFGATAGQMALGLRVAQATNGLSLGIGPVLVRYLIFATVTIVFPLGVISGIATSSDPFKRAWHDNVARSVVVQR